MPYMALALTCNNAYYIPLASLAGATDSALAVGVSAYIADLIPVADRATAYGRLLICPFIALFLASPLGALLAEACADSCVGTVFWVSAFLSVLPVIFALLFLAEPDPHCGEKEEEKERLEEEGGGMSCSAGGEGGSQQLAGISRSVDSRSSHSPHSQRPPPPPWVEVAGCEAVGVTLCGWRGGDSAEAAGCEAGGLNVGGERGRAGVGCGGGGWGGGAGGEEENLAVGWGRVGHASKASKEIGGGRERRAREGCEEDEEEEVVVEEEGGGEGAVTVENEGLSIGASVWTRRFGVLLGVACLTNLTDQGACL